MKNELVVKSNEILAHPIYKTPMELKIFSRIILELRKNPKEDVFYLGKKELLEALNCDKNSYGELKKVAERMFRPIDINKGKGGFIFRAIFLEINANLDNEILFEISPKMKPYFLDLTKNFTQYYFENIARMNSSYSIRLYEFLKQYEKIGKRKISILELRNFLNIDDFKYKLYGDFKRKAILVAQKELKEKTDLYFEFEEIKTGRKITDINFIIIKNKKIVKEIKKTTEITVEEKINQLNNEQEQIKKNLNAYGITEKVINELIQGVSLQQIETNIAYSKKEFESNKINKNFAGFLLNAIKNNYAGNLSLFEEEEKKKKADEKKRLQLEGKIKKLTNELSKKFDSQARDEFIYSLDEQQQQVLLDEILTGDEMNSFLASAIKKMGLKSPFAYSYIIKKIENFAEKKEKFIAEGLKQAGL